LQVRQSLANDSVISTMSSHTLDDIPGEISLRAEAGEISIVLAARLLDPGV
jgi:hypothetical protein